MADVMTPAPAAGIGHTAPRGVFKRRAHLWQEFQQFKQQKHSAPLPPQGRGRPLAHPCRSRCPPMQGLETLPAERDMPKLTRLKGFPQPHEIPEDAVSSDEEGCCELIEEDVTQNAPVQMFVGLYESLYDGLDLGAEEERTIAELFRARFSTGLKACSEFRFRTAEKHRGPPLATGWVTTGETGTAAKEAAAAMLAPIATHFTGRFPNGLAAASKFHARAEAQRAAQWANPLNQPAASCSWVVPLDGDRAAAAIPPAQHFARHFPHGLVAANAYEAAAEERAHALDAIDDRFWECLPPCTEANGVMGSYRQMETMLEQGSLTSYFDSLLNDLTPSAEIEEPKPVCTCCCGHDSSVMICTCSIFGPPVESKGPTVWRAHIDGIVQTPAELFAANFPKGTPSMQARKERNAAARSIQGMLKIWQARRELQRLRDLDAFFRAETESA